MDNVPAYSYCLWSKFGADQLAYSSDTCLHVYNTINGAISTLAFTSLTVFSWSLNENKLYVADGMNITVVNPDNMSIITTYPTLHADEIEDVTTARKTFLYICLILILSGLTD